MTEFADLIGIPFVWGARGPHAYDCYGLVMEMARRSGCPVPEFCDTVNWSDFNPNRNGTAAAVVAAALPQWERIAKPEAGAVVLFRMGRIISHVGFMLDDERMIHAFEDSGGVTVQRLHQNWQQRIVGFYRYVGHRNQA